MQATVDFGDKLNLFQSSHSFNTNPILDKSISLINTFLELDYLTVTASGLTFTNAGIEYMNKKYQEFLENGGNDWDFGCMASYKLKTSDKSNNTSFIFQHNNMRINISDDDAVDYNNIKFKEKAPGDVMI